jgi:hypothetical protein
MIDLIDLLIVLSITIKDPNKANNSTLNQIKSEFRPGNSQNEIILLFRISAKIQIIDLVKYI